MSIESGCNFSKELVSVDVSTCDNSEKRIALKSFFEILVSDFEANYPEAKDLKDCKLRSKRGYIIGKGIENDLEGTFIAFKGPTGSFSLSYYPDNDLFVYSIEGRDYDWIYCSDTNENHTLNSACNLVEMFQNSLSDGE